VISCDIFIRAINIWQNRPDFASGPPPIVAGGDQAGRLANRWRPIYFVAHQLSPNLANNIAQNPQKLPLIGRELRDTRLRPARFHRCRPIPASVAQCPLVYRWKMLTGNADKYVNLLYFYFAHAQSSK